KDCNPLIYKASYIAYFADSLQIAQKENFDTIIDCATAVRARLGPRNETNDGASPAKGGFNSLRRRGRPECARKGGHHLADHERGCRKISASPDMTAAKKAQAGPLTPASAKVAMPL